LASFNDGRVIKAKMHTAVHIDESGFYTDPAHFVRDVFADLNGGKVQSPEDFGYIDVAMVASKLGGVAVCQSPIGDNAHSADEWVDVASVIAYRGGCVKLLGQYTR